MSLETSTYKKAQIANAEFGGVSYVPAENLRIELFSDVVSLAGVGTPIVADGYEPKVIENNLTNFPSTSTGIKTNAVEFQFTELAEDSEEIVSAGIFDDDTDELLYRKVFAAPFIVLQGFSYKLRVGDLTLTVS